MGCDLSRSTQEVEDYQAARNNPVYMVKGRLINCPTAGGRVEPHFIPSVAGYNTVAEKMRWTYTLTPANNATLTGAGLISLIDDVLISEEVSQQKLQSIRDPGTYK